ncbi:DUF6924 domain-containing protein [Streptomyces sp. NPDC050560]|uniref:DUF6924 domain-containing protein n=1 Tax=Streptomyces sp. NPDC050560 TaxID=3365630 RepID=UPI0037BC7B71
MRTLPTTDNDEEYPPILLVRTDYRDEDGWLRVRADLDRPWIAGPHDDGLKEEVLAVDDPRWADAAHADVLAALAAAGGGDDPSAAGWDVVFLADAASMTGPEATLLAVSTDPEETEGPFRVHALQTPHKMHCNLFQGNLDYDEFAGELPD